MQESDAFYDKFIRPIQHQMIRIVSRIIRDPDEAEVAIKRGAWDYVDRPLSEKAIGLPLVRALQYRARKVSAAPSVSLKKETFEGIIGNSPGIKACLEVVAQAADSDARRGSACQSTSGASCSRRPRR